MPLCAMVTARFRVLVRLPLFAAVALAWSSNDANSQHVAPTEALAPDEERLKLRVPPGFEMQLFAAEPAIQKPMNITFDARGRLWVTDTVEYPFPASGATKPRDTVKVLEDTDGDGRADKITTFVDGLNIPLGVQPYKDGVIVYSIPQILWCRDTDGDGVADSREALYSTFGALDTHGMVNSFTRGFDGWLYACHGYANTSTAAGADQQAVTMNSGNTFRMRLDGAHIEYFSHGQVNPFGLTFDPLGDLYSADCHTLPLYLLLRGAYYPSFGKGHDGLGFGPTMIAHDHGSTAIGGVAYYAAKNFPAEFHDNWFIGNPVTCRVNRDRLEQHGSSREAIEMPDLVASDDPWFRPVNLQVGPDGALYIADFYNRIIGHYEVPLDHPGRDRQRGRIWRLVYKGKNGAAGNDSGQPANRASLNEIDDTTPQIATASTQQLIRLLSHSNLTVRLLATNELVDRRDDSAATAIDSILADGARASNAADADAFAKIHGLWVVERLVGLRPDRMEQLARDANSAVRSHLVRALAERAQWQGEEARIVRACLLDADAHVRRVAADALGRHPDAANLQLLFELWANASADDPNLMHTLRMALRDHLLAPDIHAALPRVIGDDDARRQRTADVSLGAPSPSAAAFLWSELAANRAAPRRAEYAHHVVRYVSDERLAEAVDFVASFRSEPLVEQAVMLGEAGRALQERGAPRLGVLKSWADEIGQNLLAAPEEQLVKLGIEVCREFSGNEAFDALARIARRGGAFPALRPAAIDACAHCDVQRSVTVLADIAADGEDAPELREAAVRVLGRLNTIDSRRALIDQLATAPEMLAAVVARVLADSNDGVELLLSAVELGKATPRLLRDGGVSARLRAKQQSSIDERVAHLTEGLPPADEQVANLIRSRRELLSQRGSDATAGKKIFAKSCATCHRIGGDGAKVGPNLDGIGVRGIDRLLEDVLDPNRNVDQAFRTTQIVTLDGRVIVGLVLREEGQVIVLADQQGKEARVQADEIDERRVSNVSLMPTNATEPLTEAEFADLFAYLLSQTTKPTAN